MSRRANKRNAAEVLAPRRRERIVAKAAGIDLTDVPPRNRAEKRARHFSAARYWRTHYWGKGRRTVHPPIDADTGRKW